MMNQIRTVVGRLLPTPLKKLASYIFPKKKRRVYTIKGKKYVLKDRC